MEKVDQINCFSEPRGILMPIEFSALPFVPVRSFTVSNVPAGCIRGGHAHHTTQQYLICIKGSIFVNLVRGNREVSRTLLRLGQGIFVDKLVWDEQEFNTEDSILLVLCSTPYTESDYIRNFTEYLKIYRYSISNVVTENKTSNVSITHKDDVLLTRIEELDLSFRIINCLRGEHINTLGDIIKLDRREFTKIRNFGNQSFNELRDFLYSKGLHFGHQRLS